MIDTPWFENNVKSKRMPMIRGLSHHQGDMIKQVEDDCILLFLHLQTTYVAHQVKVFCMTTSERDHSKDC